MQSGLVHKPAFPSGALLGAVHEVSVWNSEVQSYFVRYSNLFSPVMLAWAHLEARERVLP